MSLYMSPRGQRLSEVPVTAPAPVPKKHLFLADFPECHPGTDTGCPKDIDAADKTCCIIVSSNRAEADILQLVKQCF